MPVICNRARFVERSAALAPSMHLYTAGRRLYTLKEGTERCLVESERVASRYLGNPPSRPPFGKGGRRPPLRAACVGGVCLRITHAYICTALLLASASAALPPKGAIPPRRARQIWNAAPATPQVRPRADRRVLIWITPPHLMPRDPHRGYCIPYGTYALKTLGTKTGAFQPVLSDDLSQFLPEHISSYDAIILNNSSGTWITPTASDMKKAAFTRYGTEVTQVEAALRKSLLTYVEKGGGIVALHYAIGANRHWPQFHNLLGATFAGHPWNEEVGVRVEEPGNPLLAAFGGKDFSLADEIYQFGDPYDRKKLRVLLSLDPKRTNMRVKWIRRKDNDFALAWVKSHGKGRVFYTSFGHRTELYWNPKLLRFYLDAIQFATGDLRAPTTPRAVSRPVRSTSSPKRPSQ